MTAIQGAQPQYVENEVIVQFKPRIPTADRVAARGLAGATRARVLRASAEGRLEVLTVASPVPEAIALLKSDESVAFAEPNWIERHQTTSNDPAYIQGYLWGMYGDASAPANQFGSQASEAWANGHVGSSSVYVAVIDEGIDFNHPDLAANIWTNPFDPVDGIDNDFNGRIDDVHGWDFFHNDNSIYDGAPGDPETDSHGTHVSGTIGAVGGNGLGVVGVNWNVTLIGAKFLGPLGGTAAGAVAAVDYITDLKTRHGLNIVATNNSWGGGGYSQALHDAIIRGAKAGILFVAAAGNDDLDNDTSPNYPANFDTRVATSTESAATYDAVISVAALTSVGGRSSFSNYGAATVDLAAPGSNIWSTLPRHDYGSFDGTSMATPHVTGAVALYASVFPGTTASALRNAILDLAIPTPAMAGRSVTGARLNVGGFGLPAPGSFGKASPGNGSTGQLTSLSLTWETSLEATSYEYCLDSTNNGACDTAWSSSGSATEAAFVGLSPATTYYWQVRARNDAGTTTADGGAWWNFATLEAPPNAFAKAYPLNGVTGLATTAALAWQASGGATSYQFCYDTTDNGACDSTWTSAERARGALVTGLSLGATYYWQVRAQNAFGATEANGGAWWAFTVATTADKPWGSFQHDPQHTGRTAAVGPHTPALRWDFPTDGEPGSPAIDGDGTIYLPVCRWDLDDYTGYLYALNVDGTQKWRVTLPSCPLSTVPAIASDGTVYIHGRGLGGPEEKLSAISPAGSILWTFSEGAPGPQGGRGSSPPTVGADGTIYFGAVDTLLYALNPDGSVRWTRSPTGSRISSSPAVGFDGTVFLHDGFGLYAYAPDGTERWHTTSEVSYASGSPTLGAGGTAYFAHNSTNALYAVSSDGALNWSYTMGRYPRWFSASTPAVANDGTVYVVGDDGLYAMNPDGTLKWKGVYAGSSVASPIVGGDGTVYWQSNNTSFAYNSDGSERWRLQGQLYQWGGAFTGALAGDGTLYLPYTSLYHVGGGGGGLKAYGNPPPEAPTPFLSIGDVGVTEGNSGTRKASFPVTLSATSAQEVRVNYATLNGTAEAPRDFVAASGTLVFAAGQTSTNVEVTVIGDETPESNEGFGVVLSAPQNASLDKALAQGTVIDDDTLGGPARPQASWHEFFAVNALETPYVGDFNGDGLTDIITFTRQNPAAVGDVYVALSEKVKFGPSTKWHDWFAISADEQVVIGDFNGDHKDDIGTWLGKTTRQVYVALTNGAGMSQESVWANAIGFDPSDVLLAGDANGDGKDDLVCFARKQGKVYVALSTGTSFGAPAVWHTFFGVSTYERPRVADVTGDGKADIVTFATDSPTAFGDVYVAVSDGERFVDLDGVPNSSSKWHDWFAINPKEEVRIGDLNQDGKDDYFTFLPPPWGQCYTVLSQGMSMGPNVLWPEEVTPDAKDKPFVGDVNGDGKADVIVIAQGQGKVYVSLAR